jgi:16S rRNA (cytosine1402-N4)-methyltransferase
MSPHYPSLRDKLLSIREEDLAEVLREYGDVRNYRKMAQQIYGLRRKITTTLDLRRAVEYIVPPRYLKKNLHKVFQALRIWTNNELINLEEGLSIAFRKLASHGRMLVISYHSGEDRIVKRFFRALKDEARVRLLNKKVIKPSDDEITRNPRARSARLRVSEKCAF